MADPEDIERRIREREAKIQRLREAEERERRIAAADRKEQMANSVRVGGIVLVGVLVFAGAAWGYFAISESLKDDTCDWHEHATFQVYLEGQLQRWNHPYFDMAPNGALPPRAHMHQPNESQFHLEFGCATVKQVFANMQVTLRKDSIKMDDILHDGATYRENETHEVSYYLFHKVDGEWQWEEYSDRILDHQLRSHHKLLILYGNYTDEQIAGFQAAVPDASDDIPPGHPSAKDE